MDSESSSGNSPVLCQCGSKTLWEPCPLPDHAHIRRVHNILRSNTHPPDTAHFRNVISGAAPELARYDAEIERVEKTLNRLVADREVLASYVDSCRSVFSPVRHLPTELLVEVFTMCSPQRAHEISETDTPADEEDRISKKHLLQLSQVCSHWHVIVMGTSKLWSTIASDVTRWRESSVPPPILLDRLVSSLERGGNHPLMLQVGMEDGDPNERQVLEALAKHSRRWKDVYFGISLQAIQFLAGAKGNLPLLEDLYVTALGDPGPGTDLDVFAVAPQLKNVAFEGDFAGVPNLPWEQLRCFRYRKDGEPTDLFSPLSLMQRMSPVLGTRFYLDIAVGNIDLTIRVPPVVSEVTVFALELDCGTVRDGVVELLGSIFQTLTLPRLHRLEFHRDWDAPAPVWDNTHFLPFASRSSFHENLTELEIHFVITDEELLACLAVLPMLTGLVISDSGGDTHDAVVTDHLLQGLTWTLDPKSCLIPRLHFFCMTTLCKYTDEAYWDFVKTRLIPGHMVVEPFQARIWWLSRATREREISPEFLEQISVPVNLGMLGFECGQDPDEPRQ
ncbi:hypothetical protein FB451DRAFT_1207743 [Mycena latifolia]|nr:hypothetical protein FB451DRAFT_1207743 [Mycena latifolia]